MSLWLLLSAHFIADFSLQSADWAEKKTKEFRYLAGHALVYTAVLALAAFLCTLHDRNNLPLHLSRQRSIIFYAPV